MDSMPRYGSVVSSVLLATALMVVSTNGMAQVVTPRLPLKVILLGDSYSSGTGARADSGTRDFFGPRECYRSSSNWAEQYKQELQDLGDYTVTFLNRACHGAEIRHVVGSNVLGFAVGSGNVTPAPDWDHADLDQLRDLVRDKYCTQRDPNSDEEFGDPTIASWLPLADDTVNVWFRCPRQLLPQIAAVGTDTDVVLLTISGNDAYFGDIIRQCFVPGPRDPAGCRTVVTNATAKMLDIRDQLTDVLRTLRGRMKPGARVVLVSYPFIVLDNGYRLRNGIDSYEVADGIRNLQRLADSVQQSAVDRANAEAGEDFVIFVDEVKQHFDGREPDGHVGESNPDRWILELNEFGYDLYESFHPNPRGHSELATLLNDLGIALLFPPGSTLDSSVDIVFVIDTTGSMGDDIAAVKDFAAELVSQVQARTNSYRFALVTYRDFPERTGSPGDFASRIDLDFSDQPNEILAAINSLSLGYGGDYPETVYSGLRTAIDLEWRPGVKKIALQLGDAPPLDPEPITGLTAQDIIDAARAVDPAEVYIIDSSATGSVGSQLQLIADQTGGEVLRAASPSAIALALAEAIDRALKKPFAWANGPYLAAIGQFVNLDASGSFDADGEIVSYEWDVNDDGVFEIVDVVPKIRYAFDAPYDGVVALRVTDNSGQQSVGTAYANVSADGDGIPSGLDNCPDLYNHSQADYDNDGIGDACDVEPGYPLEDQPGVQEGDPDRDNDGVSDDIDNCPSVSNADQADFDRDRVGDACDGDVDGDGVGNGSDQCAVTPLGATIDPKSGCSIEQLCPCTGPRSNATPWRNHGAYVSCVAQAANAFEKAGLISKDTKGTLNSAAGQSSCGK